MAVNPGGFGISQIDRHSVGVRSAALMVFFLTIFSFVAVAHPSPVRAVTGDAQQLLSLINQERAALGVQPLTFRDDLVQIAAEHSAWMASTGIFQHRSDLSAGVSGPWTRIGENIAYGWGVASIHRMFMESKGHCENNLYAGFNRVGIEFATGGNGAMYVTVVFVQESGGSLPGPTVCPYDYTTTTTVPVTTTTTTVPVATTTTTVPVATTTTTVPVATTTTTVPVATTTTAVPVATTTTAVPVTTTTVAAAEIRLSLASTTTTTVGPGVGADPTAPEETPRSLAASPPFDEPTGPSDGDGAVPVLPVAGGAAILGGAGIWLAATKRAAVQATSSRWEIPHGGIRPPE